MTTSDATTDYAIRAYEPGDRSAVMALYELTFGARSEDWFEWRYVDNPYLSEVPIVVAERGGAVVGARPSLPVPLAVGGETLLAIMQVDPMVHPDHRRQGLFSRMVSRVYERYASREPAVSIGFPNEAVLGALEKLGEELSLHAGASYRFPEFFRVQDPAWMIREATDDAALRALGRLGAPAATGYLSARDAVAPDGDGVAVERREGVPAGRLTALVDPPGPARAVRDETFYRWRFANPSYDYRTYVAVRGGRDAAAVVAGTPTDADEGAVTNVSEVLPLSGDRSDAVAALLGAVVDDADAAAGVAADGVALPPAALARRGFHSREEFPLSLVSGTNFVVTRPLTDDPVDDWVVGGRRLSEPDNWQLTYCEREIG